MEQNQDTQMKLDGYIAPAANSGQCPVAHPV